MGVTHTARAGGGYDTLCVCCRSLRVAVGTADVIFRKQPVPTPRDARERTLQTAEHRFR